MAARGVRSSASIDIVGVVRGDEEDEADDPDELARAGKTSGEEENTSRDCVLGEASIVGRGRGPLDTLAPLLRDSGGGASLRKLSFDSLREKLDDEA